MMNYPNIYKVIFMNLVLTFHLSQCLSLASLLPQMADQNHYESLGQLAIIFIYLVNLAFNLIGPLYLGKLKYRIGFTMQALLSVPVFVPAYFVSHCNGNQVVDLICKPTLLIPLTLVGCIFLGAGLGGYFVLQNTYVSDCTNEKNKEIYFGITYMLLGCSYLLNGFISEILLDKIGRQDFFFIMGSLQLVLSLVFLFVQQPTKQRQDQIADINNQYSQLDSLSEGHQLSNEEFSKLTIGQQLKTMYQYTQTENMLQLLPLFMSTGCIIGFEFGFFHLFITDSLPKEMDNQEINKKTARVFLYLGLAQVFSGIYNGFMKQFFGILNNAIIYPLIAQIMIILAFINNYEQSYFLNILLGILIGLTDNTGQFTSVVIISDIWNESMSIFGVYLFFQNFGVILANIIAILLEAQPLFYNLILILFIQCCTSIMQHKFKRYIKQK